MNRIFRFVFIAAALATLAGCGNKGPLVLPTPPAAPIEPAAEPATPSEPAEAATDEPAADGSTTPPATPVPATSDGDGNG